MTVPDAAARLHARDAGVPSRARQLENFALFEAAWFACVLGAAHGQPAWGTAAVVIAIAWHAAISARPAALATLAGMWALLLPLAMWISDRFDCVVPPRHA